MIKVEVKYYGKPMKVNEEKTEIIKHVKNYTIDEYIKAEDYYDVPQAIIGKEVTEIFKRHRGIYSIRFYINEINKEV